VKAINASTVGATLVGQSIWAKLLAKNGQQPLRERRLAQRRACPREHQAGRFPMKKALLVIGLYDRQDPNQMNRQQT
jgi:hypothetical protein